MSEKLRCMNGLIGESSCLGLNILISVKKHVLQKKKHLKYLHRFQHHFVLVPADKAIIVVCKKYYLDVLNELSATNTYVHENKECEQLCSEHNIVWYMANNRIEVKHEHEDLPSFYWLPILHKKPYGKRFIAASNRCTTKPLSKLLTACLARITCHFKEYCNGIYNNTGVNCFWIIDNSQQVLSELHKIILLLTVLIVLIFLLCIPVFRMNLLNISTCFPYSRSI